jgi:hypothetical protein
MSEAQTVTHVRGTDGALNPITGEPPGIKEILERRAAGEPPDREPPEATPPPTPDAAAVQRPDDDAAAARAAAEIAGLRRQTGEAERRAAEAETARHNADAARLDAERRATAAVQGAEDTGYTAINTALTSLAREKEALIAEAKTAGESGDYGRGAEISARLGELGAEMRDLSRGKDELERERQTRLNAPPATAPAPQPPAPTFSNPAEGDILRGLRAPSREAFLASRSPATRDFLYQHPEFFTDVAAHQRMTGAESMARGRGLALDSPAYFDAIREAASMNAPAPVTSPPTQRQTTDRPADRTVPPAAPPSRQAQGPSGRQTNNGEVYVSRDDQTTADWMGVDSVEMVQERERLRQIGAWPYARR